MSENINEWKEVKQNTDDRPMEFVKLQEVGQEVTGKYIRKYQTKEFGTNCYVLEASPEQLVSISGGTVLDLRFQDVELGQQVKIVYLGKKLSEKTNRSYHDYQVFVKVK